MSILLPFYVWPGDGKWGPLYSAVKAHPSVNFTVIINPESGPGSGSLPDEAYLAEVPKLNAYDNVRTVGYVKTGWADNDLNTVVAEVNTYAAWSAKADNPLMSVDGIFFDESPDKSNATKREWLTTATQAVKDADGFGADKTVVLNPGTVSDYRDLSDISVEFEKSYAEWQGETGLSAMKALSADRNKVAVIMYSMPESALDEVVGEAKGTAPWIFLSSDNQAKAYTGYSSVFANLVASLDGGETA